MSEQKGKGSPLGSVDSERYARQRARVEALLAELGPYVCTKDLHYASSWRRREGVGAFFTIVRKWDRIDAAVQPKSFDMFRVFAEDDRAESILNDWLDLIGYGMVLVEHMIEEGHVTNPILSKFFEKEVCIVDPICVEDRENEIKHGPSYYHEPLGGRTEQLSPFGFDPSVDALPDRSGSPPADPTVGEASEAPLAPLICNTPPGSSECSGFDLGEEIDNEKD